MTPTAPELSLLSVLADIRQKTGVGDKVMLSELADTLGALVRNGQSAIDTNKRLVKALQGINGYAQHDDDCDILKYSECELPGCSCGYTQANANAIEAMRAAHRKQRRGARNSSGRS